MKTNMQAFSQEKRLVVVTATGRERGHENTREQIVSKHHERGMRIGGVASKLRGEADM